MIDRTLIPPAAAMSELSLFFRSEEGQKLLSHQRQRMTKLLRSTVGYNCLQLSAHKASALCNEERFGHYIQLGYAPAVGEQARDHLWSEYENLPIASNCVDVVILHHVLEFSSRPHELLREANRVLTDGGHILVVSFKPWGSWEAYKWLLRMRGNIDKRALQICQPVRSQRIHDWLYLLNYEMLTSRSHLFLDRPLFSKLNARGSGLAASSLGRAAKILSPLGLYYISLARKKTHIVRPVPQGWRVRKANQAALGVGHDRNQGGE